MFWFNQVHWIGQRFTKTSSPWQQIVRALYTAVVYPLWAFTMALAADSNDSMWFISTSQWPVKILFQKYPLISFTYFSKGDMAVRGKWFKSNQIWQANLKVGLFKHFETQKKTNYLHTTHEGLGTAQYMAQAEITACTARLLPVCMICKETPGSKVINLTEIEHIYNFLQLVTL